MSLAPSTARCVSVILKSGLVIAGARSGNVRTIGSSIYEFDMVKLNPGTCNKQMF